MNPPGKPTEQDSSVAGSSYAKERIKNELLKRRLLIERHKRNNRIITTALIIICLGVVGYILLVIRQPAVIPKSISSSANFPIFYPAPSKRTTLQESSFKYNKSLGQVSFIVNYDNQNITFAEQASPEVFSATATFYASFIQKLNGYNTFQDIDGRVDLTIPSATHDQTAVMNDKGTLIFASTTSQISVSNWKFLFNTILFTQP